MSLYNHDTTLVCNLDSMKTALRRFIDKGYASDFDKEKLEELAIFLYIIYFIDKTDLEPRNYKQKFWSKSFKDFDAMFEKFIIHIGDDNNKSDWLYLMRMRGYNLNRAINGEEELLDVGSHEIIEMLEVFIEELLLNINPKI